MNEPDSRDIFLDVKITQFELDLILEEHRQCILNQQAEAIALNTYSTAFLMRAIHAERRLSELSPEKYAALKAELAVLVPEWRKHAEEREAWESGEEQPALKPGDSWDHSVGGDQETQLSPKVSADIVENVGNSNVLPFWSARQ